MARQIDKVGRFEFVTMAGARARQLLAGCTPKIESTDTVVKVAQREVTEGVIQKVTVTNGD